MREEREIRQCRALLLFGIIAAHRTDKECPAELENRLISRQCVELVWPSAVFVVQALLSDARWPSAARSLPRLPIARASLVGNRDHVLSSAPTTHPSVDRSHLPLCDRAVAAPLTIASIHRYHLLFYLSQCPHGQALAMDDRTKTVCGREPCTNKQLGHL